MSSDDKPLTKGGNLKKPALGFVMSWVKDAWDDICQEMARKSFLKTGISNNLGGSEEDAFWVEDCQEENEEDEVIPPSWDTHENVSQEQLEKLLKTVRMRMNLMVFSLLVFCIDKGK